MKKVLFLSVLMSLSLPCYAEKTSPDKPEQYDMILEKSTEKVNIVELNKLHISENCAKDAKKCLALQATLKEVKMIENKTKLAGHPASRYCISNKARNIFLKNKKNQEYDFCLFSDNTLIDSWDLYYHFFPIERKK